MGCDERGEGGSDLRDELNVIALNVFDDHDLHLRQVVQSQLRDSIAENGLLNEEHVATRLGGEDEGERERERGSEPLPS